jgi:uncharacterized protein (DUF433 family)
MRPLIEYLEAGHTIADFVDGFPTVSKEQVIAFLEETKTRNSGDSKFNSHL